LRHTIKHSLHCGTDRSGQVLDFSAQLNVHALQCAFLCGELLRTGLQLHNTGLCCGCALNGILEGLALGGKVSSRLSLHLPLHLVHFRLQRPLLLLQLLGRGHARALVFGRKERPLLK